MPYRRKGEMTSYWQPTPEEKCGKYQANRPLRQKTERWKINTKTAKVMIIKSKESTERERSLAKTNYWKE